jgi:hypothetical protein
LGEALRFGIAVDRGADGITLAGSTVMGGITFGGTVKAPLVEAPEATAPDDPLAGAPLPVVEPLVVAPVAPVLPAVVEPPDGPPSPLLPIPEPGVPLLGEVLAPLGPSDDDPDIELSEPVEDFAVPTPEEQAAHAHVQARAMA